MRNRIAAGIIIVLIAAMVVVLAQRAEQRGPTWYGRTAAQCAELCGTAGVATWVEHSAGTPEDGREYATRAESESRCECTP
jgi:hypothetical protein